MHFLTGGRHKCLGFCLLGGTLLFLLNFVPDSETEGGESDQDTKNAQSIDWVRVDDTGQNNGKGGTSGHDNGENDCTKLGNGVIDEELKFELVQKNRS